MKEHFKILEKDKLLKRLFIVSFLLILFTIIYSLINYSKLPPLLPVFNQLPWGEDRLSVTPGIFIPSLLVLVIFVINVFASVFVYFRSPLLSRLLAITCFIATLLNLLFMLRTISLII
ncbi:MAG: hypothetical protein AAB520_03715 [Patescibacteria group bacterium]